MLFGVYYLFLFLCEVFIRSTHQPKLGVHQINQGEWPADIYRGYHYPSIHKISSYHGMKSSYHGMIPSYHGMIPSFHAAFGLTHRDKSAKVIDSIDKVIRL